MAESEIRSYANEKAFRRQTIERWLAWSPPDRDALAALALSLKISENHLRDLMDWLEEISLRDGVAIQKILKTRVIDDLSTDPRLGRADKLKRIKEQLRRRRYPRLARTEEEIRNSINALKLHPEILLSVAPGLEGGRLKLEFNAGSVAEFQALVAKLQSATTKLPLAKIFELLSGQNGGIARDPQSR